MSYTALYRKWRPVEFSDVKGQDHIVTTLKNQILSGRIGHAYLFCGTRGTGKTTIAKIFARAVNCEHPIDGSPCNECAACQAIQTGSSVNVVEIDAASNNGVDNIREIRDEVQYSPAEGKYRVYIIDEVHMLSTGAFNALLKTLEEPPAYVIFILATTDPQKIPVTVLSRCQRYDFKRISIDTIAARLGELVRGEGVDIEDKALRYVAKKADGSMRDGISLLDQCIAFHFGERLTYEMVLDVLGAVDNEIFGELLTFAIEGKTAECIYKIDEIIMQGRELSQLVSDFVWYLRNLLLLQASDVDVELLDISPENMAVMAGLAHKIEQNTLMRYIRVFSELSNQMRYAVDKRVLLEVAFVKLTKPAMEENLDSLLQRMDDLEKRLAEGNFQVAAIPQKQQEKEPEEEEPKETKQVVLPKAQLSDYHTLRSDWKKIVANVAPSDRWPLNGTMVEPVENGGFQVVFFEPDRHMVGARPATMTRLSAYVSGLYGKEFSFGARLAAGKGATRTSYVSDDELQNVFHIELSTDQED